MSLQFVNQCIGPEERRRIRSHVMKGKNAGRPRPTRKRLRNKVFFEPQAENANSKEHQVAKVPLGLHYDQHPLCFKRILWDDLALMSFPQQLNTKSRYLIRQWCLVIAEMLYPPQFCQQVDIMSWLWVQIVFVDKAYFHCALAMSAAILDNFGGEPEVSHDALKHLSAAYKLINQKLSGPDAISDSAIAVVTALSMFQRLSQQQTVGLIHFSGLHRMIQLRGSISNLWKQNRPLAQKPLRLDIEFALQQGSSTRFTIDEFPKAAIRSTSNLSRPSQTVSRDPTLLCDITPKLLQLMLDTIRFTDVLNTMDERSKLDPLDYSESVLSLLYRLVEYAPLASPRPKSSKDNLLHLTLLAFMSASLPDYGLRFARYDLLSFRLKSALQSYASISRADSSILLWALLVGGVSVFHGCDNCWMLPMFMKACQALSLHSWLEISPILDKFPWIKSMHAKAGKALWEDLIQGIGTV